MSIKLQECFPAEAGIDYEITEISIPVYYEGEHVETMEGKAYLIIERYEPYKNLFNRAQLDFRVTTWEVMAYCKTLDTNVFLTLSDVPQPRNTTLANQEGKDYPATIVYNAFYDVYVGTEKVLENQSGLGVAHEIYNVPPGTTVNFQKIFDYKGLSFVAGACACPTMNVLDTGKWEKEVQEILDLRNGKK